jgi:hypothetical protein
MVRKGYLPGNTAGTAEKVEIVYFKRWDYLPNGWAGEFSMELRPIFRKLSKMRVNFAGILVRAGGDKRFSCIMRIYKLDLTEATIIGQAEDQDNGTDKNDQGLHAATLSLAGQMPAGFQREK